MIWVQKQLYYSTRRQVAQVRKRKRTTRSDERQFSTVRIAAIGNSMARRRVLRARKQSGVTSLTGTRAGHARRSPISVSFDFAGLSGPSPLVGTVFGSVVAGRAVVSQIQPAALGPCLKAPGGGVAAAVATEEESGGSRHGGNPG